MAALRSAMAAARQSARPMRANPSHTIAMMAMTNSICAIQPDAGANCLGCFSRTWVRHSSPRPRLRRAMPPPASVVVPTRDRARYLAVALESVLPQARAAGAETLVVLDGVDAESAAAASARDRRGISHTRSRGLNAARNTGIAETSGELVVFVDDDVEVRPGWLDALLAAAAAEPEVDVFTGPVFARFEDHPFRMCGREGPPVTFLDLGPVDVDAPHAWGANLAIRRAAFERVGRFDAARPLYGDEQEWQDRLRASERPRIRYVAGAALDHRRAGDDARRGELAPPADRPRPR